MNNSTKFLAGLLAGIGVGTVVGLLMAPDKGTNTYRRIEGAVKDAAGDLADLGNEVMANARKKTEAVAKKS